MISQILEATTAKGKKIYPYRERQNCKSTFQGCIDYIDIAGRSSAMGLQKNNQNKVGESGDFQPLYANIGG